MFPLSSSSIHVTIILHTQSFLPIETHKHAHSTHLVIRNCSVAFQSWLAVIIIHTNNTEVTVHLQKRICLRQLKKLRLLQQQLSLRKENRQTQCFYFIQQNPTEIRSRGPSGHQSTPPPRRHGPWRARSDGESNESPDVSGVHSVLPPPDCSADRGDTFVYSLFHWCDISLME